MKVYLLYEGDAWLSSSSLVLMGVFEDEMKLNEAAGELISERAARNFNSEDWCDDDYDLEQFVYDETVHFAETLQTQYGEVKIMAKTATMNELGEI
jgi:phosphoribosylaminoimidazole carboxylase (NCAIR synthetase)